MEIANGTLARGGRSLRALTMHPVEHSGQQNDRTALVSRGNRDIYIREYGTDAKYNLQCHCSHHQDTCDAHPEIVRPKYTVKRGRDHNQTRRIGQHSMIEVNGRDLLKD